MKVLKKIDNKMEAYRNKDYDLADVAISGMVGICIGVGVCLIISL